jgi:uncharacterized protein YndB with AHSA1/START domain
MKKIITVTVTINAEISRIWECWTRPEHIVKWNFASKDWHTTFAENDLRKGGRFTSRMEAKDGSFGFDFGGTYDEVRHLDSICYTMDDGRKVKVAFASEGNTTTITETFEAESVNAPELQKTGWQAILDNFREYAESV